MNERQELEIQRLVDRQLDVSTRRQLLCEAEESPDVWREIALAFVEDQVWQDQVRADDAAEYAYRREENQPHSPPVALKSQGRPGASRWILMAAGVLFAATVLMQWEAYHRPPTLIPENRIAEKGTPHGLPDDTPSYASQPYTLELGNDQRTELFEFQDFERQDLQQFVNEIQKFSVDRERQERFFAAGFELVPDIQFYSGQSPDGRQIIVPIQRLRIQHSIQ